MRHLRQEHRAELAGADQRDADRLAGGVAGGEEAIKVHGDVIRSTNVVIPGRDARTRVYPSSAMSFVQVGNSRLGCREPGIHTPCGGYGFRAQRYALPRNDSE